MRYSGNLNGLCLSAALAIAAAAPAVAAEPAADAVDYLRDIKPLLAGRCYACHGGLRQKSGLRLDTAQALIAGGESGPAIVPGKSADSLLIGVVTGSAGFQMPPAGEGEPLDPRQVALLKSWIDAGAPHPDDESPQKDPRAHWAFQPIQRGEPPTVANRDWNANPIDAFLAAEHESRGLVPAPPADPFVLLRRVYLDLIGLPPTPAELRAFAADPSPEAYQQVVERLLSSPRHGERWGRHWMDVWRYSDWYGKRDINQHRNSRKNIWRWRDWIIESINADKGYDRMIAEMLAGDELAPGDENVERATGFLGRNFYVYNRHVWLQDTVEYTGMALLGLTLKCCRCHDHKYDPLTQEEYYQFRAIFEPYQARTDRVPGKPDVIKVTNAAGTAQEEVLKEGFDRVFDGEAAPTYLLARGNEKSPQTDRAIAPGVPAILGGRLDIRPIDVPIESYYPDLRDFVEREKLAAADAKIAAARSAVDKATADLQQAREALAAKGAPAGGEPAATTAGAAPSPAVPAEITALEAAARLAEATVRTAQAELASIQARYTADRAHYASAPPANRAAAAAVAAQTERECSLRQAEEGAARAAVELGQARQALKPDDEKTQQKVAAAEKSLADAQAKVESLAKSSPPAEGESGPAAKYTPVGATYPAHSTGRRLALARWITSPDNPLAARVAVNHVWLRHFGAPLVASVENFGLRGAAPTHPALLDWLASELVEQRWSMKHLHRLIVTSRAYQMQSAPCARQQDNLAADPENRYLWRAHTRRTEGEVIRDSMLHLAGKLDTTMGGPDLDPQQADTVPRRSVYFRHTPDDKPALVELFDAANPVECYRRAESVVPHQALALANGGLSLDHARLVARRIATECGVGGGTAAADGEFVEAAFEHVLGRRPTSDERQKCAAFLAAQTALLSEPDKLAAFDGAAQGQVPSAADGAQRAREGLVHVLFNHHDFVTIR